MVISTDKYEKQIFRQALALLIDYAEFGEPFTLEEVIFDGGRSGNPMTCRCPFERKGDFKKWLKANRVNLTVAGLVVVPLSNGSYHAFKTPQGDLGEAIKSLADEHLKMAGIYLDALHKWLGGDE